MTIPFGGQRRAFGLELALSEMSYDHFEDGAFDAWAELTARSRGHSLRVVAHSNAGFTVTS